MNERITYCMPSRCPLSADCQRFEDDAVEGGLVDVVGVSGRHRAGTSAVRRRG